MRTGLTAAATAALMLVLATPVARAQDEPLTFSAEEQRAIRSFFAGDRAGMTQPMERGSDQRAGRPDDRGRPDDKGKPDTKGRDDDKGRSDTKGKSDDKGRSDTKGKSDDKGRSETKGKSDDKGRPDAKGKPDDKGRSETKGKPDDKGRPDQAQGAARQMPPGLAKRDELPPGLARQLTERGTLPPGLAKRDLPADLAGKLPRRGKTSRVIVDDDVVLIDNATERVLDVIGDVVRDGADRATGR